MMSQGPSFSMCSLPSRYGRMLILACCCLWSMTIASGFSPELTASTTRMTASNRRATTVSPKPREEHVSLLVMEAIPGKAKFQKLRKRLFSRTKRDYRNDGELPSMDEGEGSVEGAATATTVTVTTSDEANDDILEDYYDDEEDVYSTREKIGKRIRSIRKTNRKARHAARELVSPTNKKKDEKERVVVETVEELRHAVLDQQLSLSDTKIVEATTTKPSAIGGGDSPLMDHAVRSLIKQRYLHRSTPGHRRDNSTLALAIEGGGMRGCVSAGMVAALTALGLSDTVDKIYGSSAGSVVGAYMVSRQVCMDIYVDILPASKKLFVCKKRMFSNLASLGLGQMLGKGRSKLKKKHGSVAASDPSRLSLSSLRERLYNSQPGMNISFVLDGIMGEDHGLRPLDIKTFRENEKKQKLRVVSSCVDPRTGKLVSRCFGSDDFFHEDHAMVRADELREGLSACLQASMTVPGATGPPVNLVRRSNSNSTDAAATPPFPCFDAFCFEPIPYRSAVEEGATHVLVLVSRPRDYMPKTQQGIYEQGVAPLYFNSHGQKGVAEYFEKGGQQYVYAEDLMLLEQAREPSENGVLVPPPEILYGVERTTEVTKSIRDREQEWNRAHLFPLRVPKGFKELETLEQNKDAVLEAVRDGFMIAFDSLSDIVGLEGYRGKDVAELVFPSTESGAASTASPSSLELTTPEKEILGTRLHVPGEPIPHHEPSPMFGDEEGTTNESSSFSSSPSKALARTRRRRIHRGGGLFGRGNHHYEDANAADEGSSSTSLFRVEHSHAGDVSAETLLRCLPGFQGGRFSHLARGLVEQHQQDKQEQRGHAMNGSGNSNNER